jgi:hypothetical protein
MSDLATVLAGLVLVVTEGTVKRSELAKLVPLELVLAFGNRRSSFNDVVNELFRLVDFLLGVRHDQAVQVLLLVAGVSCVRSSFALLDGALATNSNLCAGLRLHLLERVSTGANEKANEIDLWIVIDWHIDFLLCLSRPPVISRRVVVRKRLHRLFHELVALVFETLSVAELARVDTATEVVVLRRRRWRSGVLSEWNISRNM